MESPVKCGTAAGTRTEAGVIEESGDVLVAGGGTAGAVAAIQAARAGVGTTLVEMSGQLGGTMTNGGVDFPGYFHAWGELQVRGIGWELVKETKEFSGEALPPARNAQERRPGNYIPINMGIYAALADVRMHGPYFFTQFFFVMHD